MAPEQHAGKEVSTRSDIYALGLVLYELFTGQRAFDDRKRTDSTPTSPSSHVEGLDSTVERVILRCLEQDPALRPASVLAVSAALPGGDPLAAALAAGETPSPEMVADAGQPGVLRFPVAITLLVLVLLTTIAAFFIAGDKYARMPLNKPPDELALEARMFLESVGYDEPPGDAVQGFSFDRDFFYYLASQEDYDAVPPPGVLRPATVYFWYRQSPRFLKNSRPDSHIHWTEPPFDRPGMTGAVLDGEGRLLEFRAVPPGYDDSGGPWPDPDWGLFFEKAGFDPAGAESAIPEWTPPVACDRRWAWDGTYPDQPNIEVRVEAGAYHGRPVYFDTIPPWRPRPEEAASAFSGPGMLLFNIVFVGLITGGVLLTWRNFRMGRVYRRGALRVAAFIFVAHLLAYIFRDSRGLAEGYELPFDRVADALFYAAVTWLLYSALEPYVRRLWPEILVSWNRLIEGRLRDPLVGRDILIGALFGNGVMILTVTIFTILGRLGLLPKLGPYPEGWAFAGLVGMGQWVGSLFIQCGRAAYISVAILCLVLLLFFVLRRRWLAAIAYVLLFSTIFTLVDPYSSIFLWLSLFVFISIFPIVLFRCGLLALTSMMTFNTWIETVPATADPSAWFFGRSVLGFLILAAIALYAFYISLGGRRLLAGGLPGE
jgi:serine/threonine-protein kinase